MTGEAFEYAIKKDVRNNPIVREVDRERHREMWRSVGTGMFLVAVLVFVAWRHFELLQQGYDTGALQGELAEQRSYNHKLRLEVAALGAPARIEELATRKLRMMYPGPAEQGVIERVVASDPPAHSVLARR